MATIGYLEGIDPLVLTRLAVKGVGTLPLSNGFDNHGRFLGNLSERDGVDLIVGYLHKVLRTQRHGFFVEDLLQTCHDLGVPVWILVASTDHEMANDMLRRAAEWVTLVDPDQLFDALVDLFHLL